MVLGIKSTKTAVPHTSQTYVNVVACIIQIVNVCYSSVYSPSLFHLISFTPVVRSLCNLLNGSKDLDPKEPYL